MIQEILTPTYTDCAKNKERRTYLEKIIEKNLSY